MASLTNELCKLSCAATVLNGLVLHLYPPKEVNNSQNFAISTIHGSF